MLFLLHRLAARAKSTVRFCRMLQLLLIAYLLLVLAVLIFQRRLIYFPTKIPAEVIESVAAEHGFAPWKNPAGQIIGWKMPAKTNATASVLLVHGNAGCALSRDYLARPIHDAANADVFVLEYPGYGARTRSPSKTSFLAAAKEAFQILPPDSPRFVVSESIGAGVACDLAKNTRRMSRDWPCSCLTTTLLRLRKNKCLSCPRIFCCSTGSIRQRA